MADEARLISLRGAAGRRVSSALVLEHGYHLTWVRWAPPSTTWTLPPRDPGWDGYTGWRVERLDTGHRVEPTPRYDDMPILERRKKTAFHFV
jgi:hypothetical protein